MLRPSAVKAPATRDQADAYRFGLRRLESALVVGDPVPLHERLRTQRRAAAAGVALGILGVLGCLALAFLVPDPDWRSASIVVGKDSGALYVVARGPDRLVPVANLPAARLVLAALHSGDASARPVVVPDASLDTAPRTPTAAVAGAIAVRPDVPLQGGWAICDTVDRDGHLASTAVVGGASTAFSQAAVLLIAPDSSTWLVVNGQRHRVDTRDPVVVATFGLRRGGRAATAELVSAFPEGPALTTPAIPGRGEPTAVGKVGDVFAHHAVSGPDRFLVALADGVAEVPASMAELLRVASGAQVPRVATAAVLQARTRSARLPVRGWPSVVAVTAPAAAPVTCWTWSPAGAEVGGLWTGTRLPSTAVPVPVSQPDGPGPHVDEVVVGSGGAVRATGPGRAPGAGPLWLVASTGVTYGVADEATARALGIGSTAAAPERALRLLPSGPLLDVVQATQPTVTPP